MIKVAPSILSADFAKLGADIDSIKEADYIHFDVMDGVFVPNISFGIPVLESVRRYTDGFLDVHLMITEPKRFVSDFADAGADLVVVHLEADNEAGIKEALRLIKEKGKKTGIAIKPKTAAEAVRGYLPDLDLVLVMTVEPGFGGQKFMADMLPKITAIRREIDRRGLSVTIQVDGGIASATAPLVAAAGADIAVVGSALFNAANPAALVKEIQELDTAH